MKRTKDNWNKSLEIDIDFCPRTWANSFFVINLGGIKYEFIFNVISKEVPFYNWAKIDDMYYSIITKDE